MSTDLLRQILVNVRDYHLELHRRFGRARSNVSWLGGEPLLLPIDYLETIMALEREVFGELLDRGEIYNVVQTNLYRLTDEHLEFLLRHRWKVGVSFDVKSGARVSLNGRETEPRVIANFQRLRDRGIEPDAIAVLAGHTVEHLTEVYDFFAAHRFTRIRVLPLFSGPPERPVESILASNAAMTAALCRLFDHWLATGSQVAVEPLTAYLETVVRKILGLRGRLYDRATDGEGVLVVNTNGEVYQVTDAYEPGLAMGNAGTEPFADILRSASTRDGLARDAARSAAMCGPCSFAGACSGAFAFESPREGSDEGRCQIHYRIHEYIEGYLRGAGLDPPALRELLASLVPPGVGMSGPETVRLRLAEGVARVEITRGIEAMGDRIVDGVGYRDGAICPRADWRPLADAERADVIVRSPGPPGSTVDIAAAPPAFIDTIRACGLVPGKTEQEYAAFVRQPAYRAALEAALPELWPFVQVADGLAVLGTSVQGGGLWSTTTHADPGEANRLSGLHVDNWDQLPLGERGRGRRQLCINLGAEDRFFVFARADVDTMVGVLGEPFDRRQSYIGIGRAWFARFPAAAIVRVRVGPGEMYLAPTDNLVHDGSTVGTAAPDVTLNLRGFFHVA